MSLSPRYAATGLMLVACSLTGCRRASVATVPAAPTAAVAQSAVDQARSDSARYPYTTADIRFMSAMIGHHAQAIVMARLAPLNGASASIGRLAERIINAQEDEIAIMQQWMRERRQALPGGASAAPGTDHAGHAMHDAMMPGMLTPAQLKQLEMARGAEFDRLFLTFMIQHHQGAVSMVKELFDTPGAAQDLTVFKLANDVSVDQTTEIDRMAQMLAALVFTRPPT